MLPQEAFSFEKTIEKYKTPLLMLVVSLIFLLIGLILNKSEINQEQAITVKSEDNTLASTDELVVVEISGQVTTPGVYTLNSGSRVNDLIKVSGGFTPHANKDYLNKSINLAAKLIDGQKFYIPTGDEKDITNFQSDSLNQVTKININTASINKLESLPKIGQKLAQKIVEHRPYSSIDELKSRKIIGDATFEEVKNLISTY